MTPAAVCANTTLDQINYTQDDRTPKKKYTHEKHHTEHSSNDPYYERYPWNANNVQLVGLPW